MGVVAHPQGPLAHSTLLPVGFECSLAISLRGEGIEVGAHLWTEGRVGVSAPGGSSRLSPLSLPLLPLRVMIEGAGRGGRGEEEVLAESWRWAAQVPARGVPFGSLRGDVCLINVT